MDDSLEVSAQSRNFVELDENENANAFFVYLLSYSHFTYVGATTNLDRRLRQHNNELKGGAVYTTSKIKDKHKNNDEKWIRVCHVAGFPTWNAALQFEWRWKQLCRKFVKKGKGGINSNIDHRIDILNNKLLTLEQSTSKAVPFRDWPRPPEVVYEKYSLVPTFVLK